MKFIISIIFIFPLIVSYAIGFFHVLKRISFTPFEQFYFFSLLILSFLLNYIFRKQMSFWSIFKHELTHNIFAIITLNKPNGFTVKSGEGGLFEYLGKGNFLITLSPYFFPTITSFILLISIFNIDFKILFYSILGLTAGFDLSSIVKDIHLFQSDLKKYGYYFSISIVILGLLLFWGVLFCYVIGGWELSIDYIKYGILKIIEIIKQVINNVA